MQRVKKPQLKRDQAPKHTMTMTIVENGGSGLKNTTQVAQIHTCEQKPLLPPNQNKSTMTNV